MNKLVLIFTFFFIGLSSSFSQQKKFRIEGKVVDKKENLALESATVYLQSIADSSLITYSITDKDGSFLLQDYTSSKKVRLRISFMGFNSVNRIINLNEKNNLGTIALSENDNLLNELVLTEERAPISVRKDTVEFNVASFKTKKDANVEDLLKKLPGVEITKDGKILVNGKEVKKVMVNGKSFFGDDPTIATKNLTKDMIEKIQITDTKTKSQQLTGEKGDTESKTINLTIKKENNKGVFGRVHGGLGTDESYQFSGLFNYFNNDRRISLLAGQNNVNSPGFNFGEIRKMYGGGFSTSWSSNGSISIDGMQFGGNSGLNTSRNLGLNYVDKINDKIDITTSYFNSYVDSKDETKTNRDYQIPNVDDYSTESKNKSNARSDVHNLNLEVEYNVDTTLLISYQPKFNHLNRDRDNNLTTKSINNNNELTNNTSTNNNSETEGNTFSNTLSVTKKYGNKGGFFRLRYEDSHEKYTTKEFLNSETFIKENLQNISYKTEADIKGSQTRINPSFTFRYPIKSKKLFFDLGFSSVNVFNKNNRNSYNIDGTNNQNLNKDLSSDFKYTTNRHEPFGNIVYRKKGFYSSAKISYIYRNQENEDYLRPNISFKDNFETVSYALYFWKRFNKKLSTYFGYNLDNSPPELEQVQTFENITDPLNIRVGNPELNPTNTQSGYLGFRFNNNDKGWRANYYMNFNYQNDYIANNITLKDDLTRVISYKNADNKYRFYNSLSTSKKIRIDSLSSLTPRFNIQSTLRNNLSYNNAVLTESKIKNISPTLSLNYSMDDKIEFTPFYSFSYTNSELLNSTREIPNTRVHEFGAELSIKFSKRLSWENTLSYQKSPNLSSDFRNSFYLWNSSLNYSMFDDKATLALKGYDILNQKTNAERSFGETFTQDYTSLVLQQYFMISFSWKFNTLGAKGEVRKRRWH